MFVRLKATLLLLGSVLITSCHNNQRPASANSESSTIPVTNAAAADYSKPYLTDRRMQHFLESMKEAHNPLALIFKPGGQLEDPALMKGRIDEFNAFSRKHGFQDYEDYTGVWGRITVAQMQIVGEQTMRVMLHSAQEELKKPGLDPEMKKVYDDQVATAQQHLDDLQSGKGHSLNQADVAMVEKYKDQIDAAQKKYSAQN